ncbi:MAG: hypothetical protein PF542_02450 [Nanoarchaeota archaeon]|jgi:hypothetical protein|nr:hypothetical protein [Nanoarchaeota archaeon]
MKSLNKLLGKVVETSFDDELYKNFDKKNITIKWSNYEIANLYIDKKSASLY